MLPDIVPTHFDAHGIPNDWGTKGTIFVSPIMNAVIFLSVTCLNFWFAFVDDPKRFINLPKNRKDALTKAQLEKLRVFTNRCVFLLKIVVQGLFTYLTWHTVEIAMGRPDKLGPFFWLFIVAGLVLTGHMVWKSFRLVKTPTQMSI